jgi:hypothetical protein
MFRKRLLTPSPAMAVALVSLFLNLAGVGYAATGGTFILGRSNHAGTTTSLTGSPKSGPALVLSNATPRLPAAAFNVRGGAQPFTVNSTTKIGHLNADLVDGLTVRAFQLRSNIVRLDAPQMLPGGGQNWDIGPYITLEASCYQPSGTTHLDISLLNNAPGTGEWSLGVLGGPGPTNPAVPRENGGGITSGDLQRVDLTTNPASSSLIGPSSFGTLIWTDPTGETVTATYEAIANVHYCSIEGTMTRAA